MICRWLRALVGLGGVTLAVAAPVAAQETELEFYLCPLVFIADDGTIAVATHDGEFTGRQDGTIASLATALVQRARPDLSSTITNFFATPESTDTPLLVGVVTTPEGQSWLVSDGRCEAVPGSPLATRIATEEKLARARAFLRRHSRVPPERLQLGMSKRNLVAALYADAHERRGHTPLWPLRMCWPAASERLTCEQVEAPDVP